MNLAAVLQDGQQIMIPTKQQVLAANRLTAGAMPATPPSSASSGGSAASTATKVNLNTASSEQLVGLPRVGEVLAKKIVAWRTEHGKFGSIDDLDAVEGIGSKLLEALRPLVSV